MFAIGPIVIDPDAPQWYLSSEGKAINVSIMKGRKSGSK
jgi:hypothetical protein